MQAINAIMDVPWLCTKSTLSNIIEVANRETDVDLVVSKLGKPFANTRNIVTYHNGRTAVIPVVGAIVRYANLFTEICGGVTVETLAKDFNQVMENPVIENIVFTFDSGGGQASGIPELADIIYRARNTKNILAYVDDTAASGAYWLAAACDYVAASKMAMVGSVGAVFTVSRKDLGSRVEIVSSVSPNKRPDIDTAEGLTQVQRWADRYGEIFLDSVAQYRGVSYEDALESFGQGDLLVGQDAVEAGLIDEISSFNDLLETLL